MAGYYLPPAGSPFPAPPPRSTWSRPLPQTYSSRPTGNNTTSSPGVMVGVGIGVIGGFLLVVTLVCRYRHNSRANAAAHAAAVAAALAAPARPQAASPQPDYWGNDDEQWLHRHHRSDDDDGGRTQRASPTAGLPSFAYNREAVRHNVTAGSGDDEAAATCSVCLGAFQVGEMVRLLPMCLHLYHVDCIDPWLEAHSTCPICRSGTDDDPMMHGALLPPV